MTEQEIQETQEVKEPEIITITVERMNDLLQKENMLQDAIVVLEAFDREGIQQWEGFKRAVESIRRAPEQAEPIVSENQTD